MTGRHRGQPEAGRAEEREPKRRRTAVIGALVAVPLLAAVVAFTLGDGPDGSSRAVTPVQRTTPAAEPTYGEYVAPEAGPQAETLTPPAPTPPPAPAATPRSRPAPAETPRTRQRRDCRWEDVPVLERWCRWRGGDGR